MSADRRRIVLEGIVFGSNSTEHARLRALELLDRLDEREQASSEPPWEQPVERDPTRLAAAVQILAENGCLHQWIEPEVQRRVAEELRSRFNAVVGEDDGTAAEPFEDVEEVGGPAEVSEAVSGPETATEDLPPWSQARAVLERSAGDGDEPPRLVDRMLNRPRNH